MMRLLMLAFLFLPSCGLYRSLSENSDLVRDSLSKVSDVVADAKSAYNELKTKVDSFKPVIEKTFAAATNAVTELQKDQDGDGDVDLTDLLLGLGSLGVLGGGVAAARNKKSNDKKVAAHAELDKRIVLLEART